MLRKFHRILLISLLVFSFTFPMTLSRPAYADGSTTGLWIAGGLCSLVYTPLKAAFFLIMGISSGLSVFVTAPMDELDTTQQIFNWGYYGDWLVRPDHFSEETFPKFVGLEEEIRFVFIDPRFDLAKVPNPNEL